MQVISRGFTVYNLLLIFQASGLYKYKSYGELKLIDTETVNAVYNDLEYRKKWDAYCAGSFAYQLTLSCPG